MGRRTTRKRGGGLLSSLSKKFGLSKDAEKAVEVIKTINLGEKQKHLDKLDIHNKRLQLAATVTQKAASNLPAILKITGLAGTIAGTSVLAASGIGLPIVVAGLLAVTYAIHLKNQNTKLIILLTEHQQKLFTILRMFAIIQKVIATMKINYTEYDDKKQKILENNQPLIKTTSLQISHEFQQNVIAYTLLVKVRIPPSNSSWTTHMFQKVKNFLSAESMIKHLTEAFSKILDSFYLDAAKFNILIPFNTPEFNTIKDTIKNSYPYTKLVKTLIGPEKKPCEVTDSSDICRLTDAELAKNLDEDLAMIKEITPAEDIEKANMIDTTLEDSSKQIIASESNNLAEEIKENEKNAEMIVNDEIEDAVEDVAEASAAPVAPVAPASVTQGRSNNRISFAPVQSRKIVPKTSAPPPKSAANELNVRKRFRTRRRSLRLRR